MSVQKWHWPKNKEWIRVEDIYLLKLSASTNVPFTELTVHFSKWVILWLNCITFFPLCFRYQDMRRQIGFEIRDMWYNLGNPISSVLQYCSVLIVTNTFSFLLNEFSAIGMLEIDMCQCCDKRCFLIFRIVSQLKPLRSS